MKQISFQRGRQRPAASPAVAGFRPVALAMTLASAFAPGVVLAQPSGAQAIHGQAALQQQGDKLTITTQNGANSSHSAINWQSFSIPGGTTTHFAQPNAASTSINRVMGNNPSQILGTLSSNGKLVLVNPAGIAVGAGAMVDTAGFTASTLRMSDADALAGRLVFGDGTGGGALNVNGHVLARHGDVVLVAPDLQVGADALVQAPNGSTLLAAGQKVAVTGRGLEGIQLELKAPADQALNLGRLEGDAVGIFASQLKHSGAIQATGVTVDGGRVVLKGGASADISGTVAATKGAVGGSVHATANKVMLRSGAVIDVSGATGGGEALLGGGWQGGDARVANAQDTAIEQGATVRADAVDSGNGGTVVAWSDGATRMSGAFSARGGAASGNGGMVEVSGRYLNFQGTVDTQAANGSKGQLLLDPTNIYIAFDQSSATAAGMVGSDTTADESGPTTYGASGAVSDSLLSTSVLSAAVDSNNVTVTTTNASGTGSGFIKVVDALSWTSSNQLTLQADNGIAINGAITAGSGGVLSLRALGGSITQGAPISASGVLAISDFGSVTLTNGANSVGTLAGYAGNSGSFSFSNGSALDIGTVSGSFGVGQTTNSVSLSAQTGNLTISDTVYGVRGSAVTLQAAGAISGSKVETAFLTATAGTGIALTNVSSTGSTIGGLTAGSGSTISYTQQGTGNVTINGNIDAGTGAVYLTSGGSIQRSFGVITGGTISLDASSGIGTSGAPVDTAAASGTTSLLLSPGPSLGSAGGYISHAGDATLTQASFTNDLSVSATGNLAVNAAIAAGTGAINLKSGGTLTKAGSISMSGGAVTLVADQISLSSNTPGTTDINASTISVQNNGGGTSIEVGSSGIAGAMQIDATELAVLNATSKLHIGSATSGNLFVGGAIAPTATVLSLQAGGSITQGSGAGITATDLALRTASGSVTLTDSTNAITRLAAHVGSVTPNQSLSVTTSGALQVSTVDGISGISVPFTGSYSGGTAGVISLKSGGTLTQDSLLSGSAVAVEAARVQLAMANPTGVLAGRSTGTGSTDTFAYNSANGIFLTTVAGLSGITHAGSAVTNSVQISGTSIGQDTGGVITTAGGVQATASSGGVGLSSTNSASAFSGTAATGVMFFNSGNLSTGSISSSSGLTKVKTSGVLNVGGAVTSGSGLHLEGSTINLAGVALDAGSGVMELRTTSGPVNTTGAVSMTAGGGILLDTISVASANTVIGSGSTLTLNSTVNPGSWYIEVGTGATLNVAANLSMPYLFLTGSGVLTGAGNVSVTNYLDWSGGSMQGSGTTTLAAGAFSAIYGSVFADRGLVNNGEFAVGSGGSIGVGTGFSLQNNGVFVLEGGGGFAGGSGTIVNNGIFRKGVPSTTPPPPTTATVDVGSFVNASAGTLQVVAGDTLVFPGNFTSNAGTIALDSGATLDTMNGSLTSSGVIKGSGTLNLGTGNLTNHGKLAPGGVGLAGTLDIVAATVSMESGSVLHADLADSTNYDVLRVSKDIVFNSGATVVAVSPSAPAAGTGYDVVRSTAGVISGTAPVVTTTTAGAQFTAAIATPQSLRVVADSATGTGTGTTGTTGTTDTTATGTAASSANAEVTNLVVQFLAAFERTLSQTDDDDDKPGASSDNLVNDTSCTNPS